MLAFRAAWRGVIACRGVMDSRLRANTIRHIGNEGKSVRKDKNKNLVRLWSPHVSSWERAWLRVGRESGVRQWMTRKRSFSIFHHNITTCASEMCGHASFAMLAVSYAVSDMLDLRLYAIASIGSMMVFNFWHPIGFTLWLPFKWNSLFLILNVAWVAQMQSQIKMKWIDKTVDVDEIHRHVFPSLHKVDFGRLMRSARSKEFPKGHVLTSEGKKSDMVYLLVRGSAEVRKAGVKLHDVNTSQFVGTLGVHSSLHIEHANETVVVTSASVKVLEWNKDRLVRVVEKSPTIQAAMDAALSIDQLRKTFGKGPQLSQETAKNYDLLVQSLLEDETHVPKKTKNALQKFRHLYHVPEKYHMEAIHKYGWTDEEFRRGYRYKENTENNAIATIHTASPHAEEYLE
ncbi:hypothetical protein AAMO2058_001269900 [Amorphochlora amoebiformis]